MCDIYVGANTNAVDHFVLAYMMGSPRPTGPGRWERLERYARWRHRPPSLPHLPNDLLHYIAFHFLSPQDHYNLIEALVGFKIDLQRRDHVMAVPHASLPLYIRHNALLLMERHLYSLGEMCLFHAQHYTSTLAFINWSHYSCACATPVAEYRWTSRKPYANLVLYSSTIQECLIDMVRRNVPCAQVSVYSWICWNGRSIIGNRPIHASSVQLFPHWI